MIFRRLVNHITSGRAPFASNAPVPSTVDLLSVRFRRDRAALTRFLAAGLWTKERPDAP